MYEKLQEPDETAFLRPNKATTFGEYREWILEVSGQKHQRYEFTGHVIHPQPFLSFRRFYHRCCLEKATGWARTPNVTDFALRDFALSWSGKSSLAEYNSPSPKDHNEIIDEFLGKWAALKHQVQEHKDLALFSGPSLRDTKKRLDEAKVQHRIALMEQLVGLMKQKEELSIQIKDIMNQLDHMSVGIKFNYQSNL
jgi:hypothetical protein